MNRHLRLLTDLYKHELAHAYVILLGNSPTRIQVDFIRRERLEHVLKCEVVTMAPSLLLPLDLVEDDLKHSVTVVDLAGDGLLALANRLMLRVFNGS